MGLIRIESRFDLDKDRTPQRGEKFILATGDHGSRKLRADGHEGALSRWWVYAHFGRHSCVSSFVFPG